jgi:cation transport ATPase
MTALALPTQPLSGRLRETIESTLTADERRRMARRLGGALAAGVLLAAGLAHRRLVPGQEEIGALLLAAGAVLAMAPVVSAGVRGFLASDPDSTVDQLVSVALLAAFAAGEFETAILIPLVMEIGHFFEERSILGARAAIEGLKTLRPSRAARLGPNGEEEVAVDRLNPGDRVIVRPGQTFPADARVVRGTSAVDQSTMTGEAVP